MRLDYLKSMKGIIRRFFYLSILSLSLVGIVSCEGAEGPVGQGEIFRLKP